MMDSEHFDGLVRGLAGGTSRRGLLRQLTGAALGGVLVAVGTSEAEAKKKKHGGKTKSKAASQDKVTICHRTGSKKHPFEVITVAASAVPAHEAHGDLVDCPTPQVIDFATCTCVCAADIVCREGEHLDPVTCTCVGGGGGGHCDQVECEGRGDSVCTTCSCRQQGGCVCGTMHCPNGACIPNVGCP
jgi:hypothetical protein